MFKCIIKTLEKSCFTQAYCPKTGPLRGSISVAEEEPRVAIPASLIKIYPLSLLNSYHTYYWCNGHSHSARSILVAGVSVKFKKTNRTFSLSPPMWQLSSRGTAFHLACLQQAH